jgi:hypothetical protein
MSFGSIISFVLISAPPEDWTKQSRWEDEENFYYVGISSPSSDEKSAYDEAYQMAVKALVMEHFGRDVNVQERIFENLSTVNADRQIDLSGSNVRLKGLKLSGEKWADFNDLRVLRILIAYPKSERDAERQRQLLNPSQFEGNQVNRVRSSREQGSAQLSIESEPSGAEVYLDGEILGKTSLEASGLKAGLFDLELKLRDHEIYKTKALLSSNALTRLRIPLRKASGKIEITTDPEDAKIEIWETTRSISTGKKSLTLAAGEYTVSISHPHYLQKTETVYIAPSVVTYKTFKLEPKAATKSSQVSARTPSSQYIRVQIHSDFYPVTITFFDNKYFRKIEPLRSPDKGMVVLAPAYRYVLAQAPGQEDIIQELDLQRGELNTINFNFFSQKLDPRPEPSPSFSERIEVYSNRYPLRVLYFDAGFRLTDLVTQEYPWSRVKFPFRRFEAYGPNGEFAKGLVDYSLVPLRIVVNFD